MILALLLSTLAQATQVRARDLPCPLGQGTARVYEKVSTNAAGGFDSDLASYANAGQWRTYRIASCSPSLYTTYGTDMALPVRVEQRAAVTAALQRTVAALPDPSRPEVWDRYGIAAAVYEAMGRDHVFLGDLWTEASWTARDAAVGYVQGVQGPVGARALLDAGAKELTRALPLADRKKVLYNLARVAHRGGWGEERDSWLRAFEAAGPMDEAERAAVARFKRIAHTTEPALQDRAIARYTQALRGTLSQQEKVRVTYVLADLLRRRGRAREAVPLYFLVANDDQAPTELRSMALTLVRPLAAALERK